MMQSMGSQGVGHDCTTELITDDIIMYIVSILVSINARFYKKINIDDNNQNTVKSSILKLSV